MALTNPCDKTKIWSPKKGRTVERERREGEKREEEEEEEKKKRSQASQGMETNLEYGIVWIYGILRLCMVNTLSPNLRF